MKQLADSELALKGTKVELEALQRGAKAFAQQPPSDGSSATEPITEARVEELIRMSRESGERAITPAKSTPKAMARAGSRQALKGDLFGSLMQLQECEDEEEEMEPSTEQVLDYLREILLEANEKRGYNRRYSMDSYIRACTARRKIKASVK